jgi:hypothetical protein
VVVVVTVVEKITNNIGIRIRIRITETPKIILLTQRGV